MDLNERSLKRHEDREATIQEFVARTLKAGQPFTDPSFKLDTASIYDTDEGYAECQNLEWRRLSEVYP